MKHSKFLQITGIVLMSTLLLLVPGLRVMGQNCSLTTSYPDVYPATVNGVNVNLGFSGSGGNAGIISTVGQPAGCGFTYPAVVAWTGNQGANGAITFTFSVPVNNVFILLSGFGIFGQSDVETVNITTNGGTPTLTSTPALCSGGTISGNSYSADWNNTAGIVEVSAPSAFTTLTVTQPNPNGQNGGIAASVCLNSIAPAPVTVGTPAPVSGLTGTSVTGNPPTGVSGGTSPYTYSDGTADPLCTASPALPAGSITGLSSTTGAHSVNTVGLAPGTYQYCIKVCDSASPTPSCAISTHTIIVTAPPCNAGTLAPEVH